MVLLNLIPVIIIAIPLIIRKEKVNNLVNIIFYGSISVFLTLLINGLLDLTFISKYSNIDSILVSFSQRFIYWFFYAGISEELSKLVAIKLCKPNSRRDILLTSIFVGLIFTFIEDILYSKLYYESISLVRIVSPFHILFQLIMAFFLIKASESDGKSKKIGYTILALMIPAFLHGLYDACGNLDILKNYLYYFGILIYPLTIYLMLKEQNSADDTAQNKDIRFKRIKIFLVILLCLMLLFIVFGTKPTEFGTPILINDENIEITVNNTKNETRQTKYAGINCYSVDITIKNNDDQFKSLGSFWIKDERKSLFVHPLKSIEGGSYYISVQGDEQLSVTLSFDLNEIKNLSEDYCLVYEANNKSVYEFDLNK